MTEQQTADMIVEVAGREYFRRWQEILWEGGAKTISWDELGQSEKWMVLDCTASAIASARPMIAAEERERCARFAAATTAYDDNLQKSAGGVTTGQRIAAAIRAMGVER